MLDVDGLSRQHARLWLADGSAWIEDCASTNRTLVNGVRITGPTTLWPCDLVAMGALRARVTSPAEHREDVVRAPASQSDATETTRYLCAAVHLDDRFAGRVVDQLVHERFRALAPAYGVDLAALAAHAVMARRRLRRDAALLAVLLLSVGGTAVVAAVVNPTGAAPWVVIGLLAAWAITTVEIFVMRHRALRRLSIGRTDGVTDRPRMSASLQERFEKLRCGTGRERGRVPRFQPVRRQRLRHRELVVCDRRDEGGRRPADRRATDAGPVRRGRSPPRASEPDAGCSAFPA